MRFKGILELCLWQIKMHTDILTYIFRNSQSVYLCNRFEYCVKHYISPKLTFVNRFGGSTPCGLWRHNYCLYFYADLGTIFKSFVLPFGGSFFKFPLRMALKQFCKIKNYGKNREKVLTITLLSGIIELPKERNGNTMNEKKIQFNDDFVRVHVQELLDLKIDRSIITNEQMAKVSELLELSNDSAEQLTAKRNSVVKLLTDDRDDDAAWATMSGVTHVIDGHIMTLIRTE